MSCCLLEFCRVQELKAVREFLFQNQQNNPSLGDKKTENELAWDDSDWGSWDNPEAKEDGSGTTTGVEEDSAAGSAPWLQDCVVSLSPCSDLMVVAKDHKAVFLSGMCPKTQTRMLMYTQKLSTLPLLKLHEIKSMSSNT
ncbi:unnamed protein product [Oncorhynchus mykiss]|uniref:Rab3-GAP regulatory subunit N-terminal domain-containing protein n=1 Tax=Oncorhynchus mykiss TaxID=8022 RepID=A0A060Z5K9_ONCMY|nr:unnamed protein product [Oncorhynchus mykiss]